MDAPDVFLDGSSALEGVISPILVNTGPEPLHLTLTLRSLLSFRDKKIMVVNLCPNTSMRHITVTRF